MSLSVALSNALTGLQFTSTATNVVANNISNASNSDYVKRSISAVEIINTSTLSGVRTGNVTRQLNTFLQDQLRTETSSASYADTKAQYMSALDTYMGTVGGVTSLDTMVGNFQNAAQALANSPESSITRSAFVQSAQALSDSLNTLSDSVQALRNQAQSEMKAGVTQLNSDLTSLQKLNMQIFETHTDDPGLAGLLDQRDALVSDISTYVGVRPVTHSDNTVSLYLSNGTNLLSGDANQLSFSSAAPVSATSIYSASGGSGVGAITLATSAGTVDLIANGSLSNGKLGALVNLRDSTLVTAQSRLDALAAGLAQALGNSTTASTAITNGLSVNTSGLQQGNIVTTNLTVGGTARTYSFVNLNNTTQTLPTNLTPSTNDTVVAIDFSGTDASIQTAIQSAVGSTYTVSYAAGTLQIAANSTDTVNGLSASITQTSTQSGTSALPLFTDGDNATSLYTGNVTNGAWQQRGLAQRLKVNPAVLQDSNTVIAYNATTSSGDNTRPSYIATQLSSNSFSYQTLKADGSTDILYTGSISGLTTQIMAQQAADVKVAQNQKTGQDQVLTSLQTRSDAVSGVNIDEEMASLITLQNNYSANARVMSAVKEMYNALVSAFQ
jgi:flagellar hook-associated protein 1 FlgK